MHTCSSSLSNMSWRYYRESSCVVLLSTEMHYRSSFTPLIIKKFRPLNHLSQARGVSTLDWTSNLTLSATLHSIFYFLRTEYVTLFVHCTLGSTLMLLDNKGVTVKPLLSSHLWGNGRWQQQYVLTLASVVTLGEFYSIINRLQHGGSELLIFRVFGNPEGKPRCPTSWSFLLDKC